MVKINFPFTSSPSNREHRGRKVSSKGWWIRRLASGTSKRVWSDGRTSCSKTDAYSRGRRMTGYVCTQTRTWGIANGPCWRQFWLLARNPNAASRMIGSIIWNDRFAGQRQWGMSAPRSTQSWSQTIRGPNTRERVAKKKLMVACNLK